MRRKNPRFLAAEKIYSRGRQKKVRKEKVDASKKSAGESGL